MKKTMILLLTFLLSLFPAAAMGNIADDFQLGHHSDEFTYTGSVNTANYTDNYGLSTKDVSYGFTTTKTFDLHVYARMKSSSTTVKIYLLDKYNNLISSNGWYEKLPAGTYHIVLEGKDTNGEMEVDINLNYPTPERFSSIGSFYYTDYYETEESLDSYNDIMGNGLGDILLHFELEKPMRVHISQTGGSEQNTSIHLWNVEMQVIASNLSHPADNPPASPGYAAMSIDLEAGHYYMICEPLDEYTDNSDRFIILLFECEEPENLTINTSHNYIFTRTHTAKDNCSYLDRVTYFDGLGRPEQTINLKAGSTGKDIVTMQEYDGFGREGKTWLPRAANTGNNGNYVKLSNFQTLSTGLYNGDTKAYTLPVYEASPLKRILEQYGAGEDWYNNGKSTKNNHLTNIVGNDTLDCAFFKVEDEMGNDTLLTLKRRGSYASGELAVTRTEDEDGNRTFEFTDKLGRIVLTRNINGNEKYDTYRVANIFDKPCAVIPPAASQILVNSNDTCWSSMHEVLESYVYLYRYDGNKENLCIAKKIPGCGWTKYKYDQTNRMIFTQDAVLRKQGKWQFTIPDTYGRICMTGICENTESSMQYVSNKCIVAEKKQNEEFGYAIKNNAIALVNPMVTTVNYYDGYTFRSLPYFMDTALNYATESGYDACFYTDQAEGLLTGTLTATIDGGTVTGYLPTVMYYDYRGRLVQTKSGNHLGGMEEEWLSLDFTGNVTKRKHVHTASGKPTQTEIYTYTYDRALRQLTTRYSLNGAAELTLVSNKYDELGRLKEVSHNNKSDLTTSYNYNVRSWITQTSNQRYSQTLAYSYGGNISSQQWIQDGKTRKYTYTYDDLNRLTNAAYTGDGNYNTSYSYDKMGNITSLKRYDVSLVDNLTLTYNGNQLTKVEDAANNTFGFANGANAATEYFYDANGNLTKDLNKGITNISYNMLSLPSVVTFSNGSTITYLYTADGRKLRTVHVINGTATTTDYCGNVIYENGTARLLLTEAGYIDLSDNSRHFYIKDHLGNNRIVADANGYVEESNQYYPFGLLYANSNSNLQPYKYNGKELDTKGGLNWYDYGARHYDAALGRWHVVDPLSEKYYSTSPYSYCLNNPVKFMDPDGKDAMISIKGNTITITSNIILTGSKATKELAQTYQQNIMDNWGQLNTYVHKEVIYNIVWDVNVRVAEEGEMLVHDGINNFLEVTEKGSRVGNTNEGRIRSTGLWGKSFEETNPMSHEFGHILGMLDKYEKDKSKTSYGEPISSDWEGNIMAEESGQGKAENKNLKILLPNAIDYLNSVKSQIDIAPWMGFYYINNNNREW